MSGDFLKELFGRLARARAARPEVAARDLMFTAAGDEEAITFDEINARGRPTLFVCLRVEPDGGPVVVAGSVVRACGRCGASVWMSPATLAAMGRIAKAEVVCLVCAGRE